MGVAPPAWLQWLGLALDAYQQYRLGQDPEGYEPQPPPNLPALPPGAETPLSWPPGGTAPHGLGGVAPAPSFVRRGFPVHIPFSSLDELDAYLGGVYEYEDYQNERIARIRGIICCGYQYY